MQQILCLQFASIESVSKTLFYPSKSVWSKQPSLVDRRHTHLIAQDLISHVAKA